MPMEVQSNTSTMDDMEASEDQKDRDLEAPDDAGTYVLPIAEVEDSDEPRRRASMNTKARSGFKRIYRGVRWILGPAQPIPESELPRPSSSSSFSITLGNRSSTLRLDPSIRSVNRSLHLRKALIPFLLLWATANVLLTRQQYYLATPEIISCDTAVWGDWPPDTCGLNATGCASQLVSGTYRCMGGCRDVVLGNPRWVGGQRVNSVPLVIGGGDDTHTYRADSWICSSALHAGLISPTLGGCVYVNALPYPTGSSNFSSTRFSRLTSTAFGPHFPGAFALSPWSGNGCLDIHPIMTGFNAFCLLLTTLFLSPSQSLLFSILLILGYLHIFLFSDPPTQPPDWSAIVGGLLPVVFTGYWIYNTSFKRTLRAFTALPFDLAWWQGAGYWIGIESSTIFAKLPIQRLGYGGLSSWGVITIIIIAIVAALIVGIQAWQMRKAGLLQYYLFRYLPLMPIMVILANIPGYTLRLHHYLYTLAALPVLSLSNRVSLFGQAFALGLFLDGVGRWGWASIIQNTGSLLGDAAAGTGQPTFLNTSNADMVSWVPLDTSLFAIGFSGISMLVDDVQQIYNYANSSYPLANLGLATGVEHSFRLAWIANGSSLDYTDPATLGPSGVWTLPS